MGNDHDLVITELNVCEVCLRVELKKRASHLLNNSIDCLTGITEVIGSNPVEDACKFAGAYMRQPLKLSRNCGDLFFNFIWDYCLFLAPLLFTEHAVSGLVEAPFK